MYHKRKGILVTLVNRNTQLDQIKPGIRNTQLDQLIQNQQDLYQDFSRNNKDIRKIINQFQNLSKGYSNRFQASPNYDSELFKLASQIERDFQTITKQQWSSEIQVLKNYQDKIMQLFWQFNVEASEFSTQYEMQYQQRVKNYNQKLSKVFDRFKQLIKESKKKLIENQTLSKNNYVFAMRHLLKF